MNVREVKRWQLERQMQALRTAPLAMPQKGWISALRDALGMSLDQLGRRLGMTRQGAHRLERGEVDGTLTINKLKDAAKALNCDCFIVMVPKLGLTETIRQRAVAAAKKEVGRVAHSMALEGQAISTERQIEMIESLADDLVHRGDPLIWE